MAMVQKERLLTTCGQPLEVLLQLPVKPVLDTHHDRACLTGSPGDRLDHRRIGPRSATIPSVRFNQ
tara:strand:+ start:355 stop:552 length:198 start_codon:yes stop_codon:yes gene_type:complete